MNSPDVVCPHVALRDGERPVLMGSRCADCDELYFPPAASCTRCLSRTLQPAEIGDRGTLWSWTVQAFLPKSPAFVTVSHTVRPAGLDVYVTEESAGLDVTPTGIRAGIDDVT